MNNHELLEVLREELSKHTRLKLVIKTGITIDRICEFRICGYSHYNWRDKIHWMSLVIIMVDDSLIIRTNPYRTFSFSDDMRIPLCDPEMFNRIIAVIKNLENTVNNSKRLTL